MPLNPDQTDAAFAVRTLWLYLTWHYPKFFRDKWLISSAAKRGISGNDISKFLRSNPAEDSVYSIEPIARSMIAERVHEFREKIAIPDYIRPYFEEVIGKNPPADAPFNASAWEVWRRLNLDNAKIRLMIEDIGGFWYVLRGDTGACRSDVAKALDQIDNEEDARACPVQFNLGVLRVSDLAHSSGPLPQFRYETAGRSNQNMRLSGFVFPTGDEVIFQGAYGMLSTGQITWAYIPEPKPEERMLYHHGLMLARNRSSETIAGPGIFLRVPLSALGDTAAKDCEPINTATIAAEHNAHFTSLTDVTRAQIGLQKLPNLLDMGVLSLENMSLLKKLFVDETLYLV